MGRFTPVDALPFVAGVDRSPTEVAVLFLGDRPTTGDALDDAVVFLVEALGLSKDEAVEAISYIPGVAAAPPAPAADKASLLARAAELGIEAKGNWGAARIASEIERAEFAAANLAALEAHATAADVAMAAAKAADGVGTPAESEPNAPVIGD